MKCIICVAKEVKLSEGGDNVLSSAVKCCGKFAINVVKEVANNSEENLLKLNKNPFWFNSYTE